MRGYSGHVSGTIQEQLHLLFASPLEFEGNEPRQQRRRIELADNLLDVCKAARDRMYGNDVTIADRRKGHEAEIDQVTGNSEIIL